MITLTLDLVAGLAKLSSSAATIVKGVDVPVQVILSAVPGTFSGLYLVLCDDSSTPQILAFTDAFEEENATTYNALLDASDTRLATFMTGKGATPVNAQLGFVLDGASQIAPNVSISVQQNAVTGAETSDGGPTYYTSGQVDSAIAAALAGLALAAEQTPLTPAAAVTTALFAATLFSSLAIKIAPTAGSAAFTAAYTLPDGAQTRGAIVEVNVELPASANPTVTLSDGAGTLLATIAQPNPALTVALFWYGRFRFDGAAWHCLFRAFQS